MHSYFKPLLAWHRISYTDRRILFMDLESCKVTSNKTILHTTHAQYDIMLAPSAHLKFQMFQTLKSLSI